MANENSTLPPDASAAPKTETQTEQPRYMTAEDFNGAMTARDRRLEQRIEKLIQKSLASQQSPSASAIAAEVSGEEEGATGQEPVDGKKPSGPDLAIKRATAKIEALHKQMQAKDEAAAKKEADLLARQERAEITSALTEAGVTMAKAVYAMFRDEGRISRNADGELVMKVTKEYGEDEVPVSAGIKEWLATPEGKHFAPPRGGGEGSGTVVRGGASRTGGTLSKEEAKREAQKMLSQFIFQK